jgi:hypothetical protein
MAPKAGAAEANIRTITAVAVNKVNSRFMKFASLSQNAV